MSVFPNGPIGFQVFGIGFEDGNPMVDALVAVKNPSNPIHEKMKFVKVHKAWFCGTKLLDTEEQEMLENIWEDQIKKNGVPKWWKQNSGYKGEDDAG